MLATGEVSSGEREWSQGFSKGGTGGEIRRFEYGRW